MSRTYTTEAIIINRKNFGEGDRLITVLSKYRGKFNALAKGVRKVASRRGPNLDLLNHVKASFYTGKNIDVITEVQTMDTFRDLKSNLKKIGSGYFISEIAYELLAEGQDEREIFNLLLRSLKLLDQNKEETKINKIVRGFELKFLYFIGLRPQLDRCSLCDKKLSNYANFISPETGGVVGSECAGSGLFSKRVSKDALKVLRFYQTEGWPRILKLKVSDKLEKEIQNLLAFYMNYVAEKDLYSEKFLTSISR